MRVPRTIACANTFRVRRSIWARLSRRERYEHRVSVRSQGVRRAGDRRQWSLKFAIVSLETSHLLPFREADAHAVLKRFPLLVAQSGPSRLWSIGLSDGRQTAFAAGSVSPASGTDSVGPGFSSDCLLDYAGILARLRKQRQKTGIFPRREGLRMRRRDESAGKLILFAKYPKIGLCDFETVSHAVSGRPIKFLRA